MGITKTIAAQRQLEAAIELFFSGRDPIAVATLAYNALEITATLARRRNLLDWTSFEEVGRQHSVTPTEVRKIFHAPRNFFKHADRDPDEVLHDWSDDDSSHLLALTVLQFGEIAERSLEMWSALIWYYATHPNIQPPPGNLAELAREFSYIANLDPRSRLMERAKLISTLRQRAR